jgi:DNA-binding response OmpR family regulator
MLTARQSMDDKVSGLAEGADDYVTKPFAARELLARVRAVGRRADPVSEDQLEIDGASIDLGRLRVDRGEVRCTLTSREAGILRLLYGQRGRAVARTELLEKVWGSRPDLKTRAVDMAISTLRKKIERDPAEPRIVVSVVGVGYAWGD